MKKLEFITAYATYTLMDIALRIFGLEPVLNWVIRRLQRRKPARDAEVEVEVERVQRAVDDVRRFYPDRKNEDCLPRALAIFYRLRLSGLPAELLIGVKRYPFRAHSWVECQGRVIGDRESVREFFTPLKRIAC